MKKPEQRNFDKICRLTGLGKKDLKTILQKHSKEKKANDTITVLDNGIRLQILDSSDRLFRIILWKDAKMLLKTVIMKPEPRVIKNRRSGLSEIVGVIAVVAVVSAVATIFWGQNNENIQATKQIQPDNINLFVEDRFPTSYPPPPKKVWLDMTMTGPLDGMFITGDIEMCLVPTDGTNPTGKCQSRPANWSPGNPILPTTKDVKITASGNALLFKYSGPIETQVPVVAGQSLIITIHYGFGDTLTKQVEVRDP